MQITEHMGRTILTEDGMPVLLTLATRPSETAPGRTKATFVAESRQGFMPMPIAKASGSSNGYKPNGYTTEFRIEAN